MLLLAVPAAAHHSYPAPGFFADGVATLADYQTALFMWRRAIGEIYGDPARGVPGGRKRPISGDGQGCISAFKSE